MKVTNTKTQGGLPMLLDAMSADTTEGQIEAQEARGQREFVESTQLPIEGSNDLAILELGIEFGEPTLGDELFCEARLPEGWAKRATEHSMWSELVDEAGKVRAKIFYKAAFYDRRAFIRIAPND